MKSIAIFLYQFCICTDTPNSPSKIDSEIRSEQAKPPKSPVSDNSEIWQDPTAYDVNDPQIQKRLRKFARRFPARKKIK